MPAKILLAGSARDRASPQTVSGRKRVHRVLRPDTSPGVPAFPFGGCSVPDNLKTAPRRLPIQHFGGTDGRGVMRTENSMPTKGISSINPANGEVLRHFDPDSNTQIDQKLQRAQEAFLKHRQTGFPDRSARLTRAAEI